MSQNFYNTQKMAETHRYELMREAEQQRLAADLPQQQNGFAAKIGMFFTKAGTSLKQLGQKTAGKQGIPTGGQLFLHSPHH